ncbi:sensor histidine kinase [Splendidivirga corallicola]
MFIVAILGISITQVEMKSSEAWSVYLSHIVTITIATLPILTVVWYKQVLKARFRILIYLVIWTGIFIIYPILLATAGRFWHESFLFITTSEEFFVIVGLVFFYLEIGIEINRYLPAKIPQAKGFKRINFEKAMVVVLFLWALLLALFAASNIEQFRNDYLVDISIDLKEVIKNFFPMLGITIQLFISYLAGFSFYLINRYFLFPRLLKQRGILVYAMGVGGTILLLYPVLAEIIIALPVSQNVNPIVPSESIYAFEDINGLVALGIMGISLPVILVIDWFKQNSEIESLGKQKAETELSLLKQQMNPHFFFNTLNNLYALSLAKSESTPEVILQLSELMRYVIYEGKEKKVLLMQEVKYIEDYINLQQIRLHKKPDLRFEKDIEDKTVKIPPLLLIVFVENAFKHGIEPSEGERFLHMKLHCTKESLTFSCKNSFERMNPGKGIGLENLKRRLALLFPNKHELNLIQTKNTFEAKLTLHF